MLNNCLPSQIQLPNFVEVFEYWEEVIMINLKNPRKFRKSKCLAEQFYTQAYLRCGRAPKWVFCVFCTKAKKTQLVNPSWGRLGKTISFELRHSPDCSEIKKITYEGKGRDNISNPSFCFPLQQGRSPCKSFTKWNTVQHNVRAEHIGRNFGTWFYYASHVRQWYL